MQRSKTPWKVGAGTLSSPKIYDSEGVFIVDCNTLQMMSMGKEKVNAAFIVKAVNCHDELLAALKKAEQLILRLNIDSEDYVITDAIHAAISNAEKD